MTEFADSKDRLVFVTGTRADFGKTLPLANVAQALGYSVTYFVTGMHMSQKYGLTKEEVHEQVNGDVYEFINQRSNDPQDIVLAKTILGFSDFLKERDPYLVFVHGDRVEALACAIACSTNYVRCVHIEGGEISGTIDEIFRHCISKSAWAHLPSSESAAKRLVMLGEERDRIFVIGSPEIDVHRSSPRITLSEVLERYEIPVEHYGICVFHPVTSEIASLDADVENLFDALEKSDRYFVVIKPNNDPGNQIINARLEKLPPSRFRLIPSMRFHYFSTLLRHAYCVVGNSSTGVREAPAIGVPSLNIGSRQTKRASGPSIVDCLASDKGCIDCFLKESWGKRFPYDDSFGSGLATEKFAQILNEEQFWRLPMQKFFADV